MYLKLVTVEEDIFNRHEQIFPKVGKIERGADRQS